MVLSQYGADQEEQKDPSGAQKSYKRQTTAGFTAKPPKIKSLYISSAVEIVLCHC